MTSTRLEGRGATATYVTRADDGTEVSRSRFAPDIPDPRPAIGARITRADDGSRSPAIPFGSMGTVVRWTDFRIVVVWDAAPGGTYVYLPSDDRIAL